MAPVRTAVIPAAGLGTRFLPASKAIPKEMIPVVDKPTIQYIVEEAVASGIEDILIIVSDGKEAIADHFDRLTGLEAALEAKGKDDDLAMIRGLAEMADIHFIRQGVALGLGHAIGVARRHVGNQTFAVMLGDDLQVDGGALLQGMIATHAQYGGSVIATIEVPSEEISHYGCIDPVPVVDNLNHFTRIVEKPAPQDAPSNLAVIGRYVFTPEIFAAIDATQPGVGGEIQITDAIGLLNQTQPVTAYTFTEGRYDCGKPLDYLKATVEIGAARDDLGPSFREYLKAFVATLD